MTNPQQGPQPPRGMRDFLPAEMRRRLYVIETVRSAMEAFGYEPLETPAMEEQSTLLGKYGPDAERLIYRAGLREPFDLALRYDLSVPLARVAATYDDLPQPFRRYQISPVWRGERPQLGRYREFVQADADIVGSASLLADAEIIALVVHVLTRLGFSDTVTKVNNRKVLTSLGRHTGVPESLLPGLYRAIDKLDKIGVGGVRRELLAVGISGELANRMRQGVERVRRGTADPEQVGRELRPVADEASDADAAALDAYVAALREHATEGSLSAAEAAVMNRAIAAQRAGRPPEALLPEATVDELLSVIAPREGGSQLEELETVLDDDLGRSGLADLGRVIAGAEALGVPRDKLEFDPAMVRGLEYYTGTIFETVVTHPPIGSITGGGRFDGLVGIFGRDLPAVGTTFGIDRLVDAMTEHDLFPETVERASASILVTVFDTELEQQSLTLAAELRDGGLPTELSLEESGLGDQIRYAVKREIPLVAILGPDEAEAGQVTLRDLRTRDQVTVDRVDAVSTARGLLFGGTELA